MDPFPIGGTVLASDGTSSFPDAKVTVRNITKHTKHSVYSNPDDGSYVVDLSDPEMGGWDIGDLIDSVAHCGSFYARETYTVEATPPSGINLTLAVEDGVRIIDIPRLNQEFTTFFRKNLEDPKVRGTFVTETQIGTGTKVKFTLNHKDIKYITSVRVNDVTKTEWEDYYVDFKDSETSSYPVIYFLTPPANGAKIDFNYNYGTSWIYPDKPRLDLSLDNYPRCTVTIFPVDTREGGLGATSNLSNIKGEIMIWSERTNELFDLISKVRTLVLENKKNFHHFKLITPTITSRPLGAPTRGDKIVQMSQAFSILLKAENIENS